MTRARVRIGLVALAAALCAAPLGAAGQRIEISLNEFHNPALRILQDYTLRQGDTVEHVVVIGGNARIEGHVTEDVVVVLGKAELASTAVIEGTVVTVAGTAEVDEGAKVGRDFVVIGDAQTPSSFSPGGQHVVIGLAGFGEGLRSLVPWLTHGLLLGRPIVPWLGWVWIAAAIFFFINLCVNALFDTPVRTCTVTLRDTPLSAFMAGLLVLLLAGPLCFLLAVSVIGIAVIPFVLCAIVAAAIVGRVAFARWIGMTMVHQADPADRQASMRSFLIGSAVMCVAYLIPVIGFIVWAFAGVFGLGAATLAFNRAYRRENPKPPKGVKPSETLASPPVVPYTAAATDLGPEAAIPSEPAAAVEGDRYANVDGELPPASEPAGSTEPSAPPPTRYRVGDALLFPKAAFAERLAGLVLDAIAIGIIAQLLSLDRGGDAGERLILFLALAYHVGFWTWRGTTPGGMLCQLRVIRTDGRALDFPESLVRGLTGILSLAVVGLGFLWILRDPERQAWHDRVAGTYVVKVPRAYPI
jgi:uncharacterized RDD family membrane protein YckC